MRHRFYYIFVFVVLITSYGCPSGVIPSQCRDFFNLPSRERATKFREYPLEKQVDLYLCGMNREPPESGYAAYIAEGGEPIIPYLLERLKKEQLEVTQTWIMDIFTVLAVKGNLRDRQDVVTELEAVIAKMKFEPMKLKAQRYVELIKKENSRTNQN